MKINLIEQKEITEFEKELGYELEVNERPFKANPDRRFSVSFPRGEIMQNCALLSRFGYGATIDEALKDYAAKISGNRMAFDTFTPDRKEFDLPGLVHTKLLNR